ncbi:MAG: hypothetical protein IJI22_04325 [Bacilli bacterium]|nr:hypothetical protein [Bacilli bacterium]
MQNKRVYVAILVFILAFGLLMFLALGLDNIKKNNRDTILIVGNNTVWTYNKQHWRNINSLSGIENLNWEEFTVFDNSEKLGNYYLWYSDKWYLFDKKKNAVNFDGNLLAYRANYDIDVLHFEEKEITDDTYVKYVLEENNLDIESQFTAKYKVDLDIDKDDQDEEFYLISNAFPMDFDPEKIFSIVFMIKDDYIYYLYNDISNNTSFNGCKPYFKAVLDADDDDVYEIVVSCAQYSNSNEIDMLYKYEEDAFKIVISNQ